MRAQTVTTFIVLAATITAEVAATISLHSQGQSDAYPGSHGGMVMAEISPETTPASSAKYASAHKVLDPRAMPSKLSPAAPHANKKYSALPVDGNRIITVSIFVAKMEIDQSSADLTAARKEKRLPAPNSSSNMQTPLSMSYTINEEQKANILSAITSIKQQTASAAAEMSMKIAVGSIQGSAAAASKAELESSLKKAATTISEYYNRANMKETPPVGSATQKITQTTTVTTTAYPTNGANREMSNFVARAFSAWSSAMSVTGIGFLIMAAVL